MLHIKSDGTALGTEIYQDDTCLSEILPIKRLEIVFEAGKLNTAVMELCNQKIEMDAKVDLNVMELILNLIPLMSEVQKRQVISTALGNPFVTAIQSERERQKTKEGWTTEHDDEHSDAELALAAAVYCLTAARYRDNSPIYRDNSPICQSLWPGTIEYLKPKNPVKDLIRAGALIVAELERLDRLERVEVKTFPETDGEPQGTV